MCSNFCIGDMLLMHDHHSLLQSTDKHLCEAKSAGLLSKTKEGKSGSI